MTYFNEIVKEVAAWRKKFSGMRPKQIAEKLHLHPTGMPMGNHKGCLKGILFRSSREYTLIYNTDLDSHTQDSIIMHEIAHYLRGHLKGIHIGGLEDTGVGYLRDCSERAWKENDANYCMAEYLLDTGETLQIFRESGYDFYATARRLNVYAEILDFKLRLLHKNKLLDEYRDCLNLTSDCLNKLETENHFCGYREDP